MSRLLTILLAFVAILIPTVSSAQTDATPPGTEEKNVVERIVEESNGNVTVEVSEELLEYILRAPKVDTRRGDHGTQRRGGINKAQGYRIQVFSDGRNQHSLEARARARGSAILARFPKYRGQVYTFSKSPNWYTRVGNFRTSSEASAALAELKRAFPGFASEMRMVKCQIVTVHR